MSHLKGSSEKWGKHRVILQLAWTDMWGMGIVGCKGIIAQRFFDLSPSSGGTQLELLDSVPYKSLI